MVTQTGKYILLFISLALVQTLVVDNIVIGQLVNPFIYLLFIILLPFWTPSWIILVTSFLLGIFIDLFHYSPGMHASAAVLAGFIRSFYFNFFQPEDEPGDEEEPHIYFLGFLPFLIYSVVLVVSHHFYLFMIQSFGKAEWGEIFLRTLYSSAASLFLIIVTDLVLFHKKRT